MKQLNGGFDMGSPHVDPPARRPRRRRGGDGPRLSRWGSWTSFTNNTKPVPRLRRPVRRQRRNSLVRSRNGNGADGMSCDSPRHQPAGPQGRPRNRRKGRKGAAQPPRPSSRPRPAAPAATAGPYAAAAFFASTVKLLRKQHLPPEELTRVLREAGTAASRIAVGPPAPPPPRADPTVPPQPPPAAASAAPGAARTSKAARRKERRRRRAEARETEHPPESPHSSDWGIPSDEEACTELSTARVAEFANRLLQRVATTGDVSALARVRHHDLIYDQLAYRSATDPSGEGLVLEPLQDQMREVLARARGDYTVKEGEEGPPARRDSQCEPPAAGGPFAELSSAGGGLLLTQLPDGSPPLAPPIILHRCSPPAAAPPCFAQGTANTARHGVSKFYADRDMQPYKLRSETLYHHRNGHLPAHEAMKQLNGGFDMGTPHVDPPARRPRRRRGGDGPRLSRWGSWTSFTNNTKP
eukprot:gene27173-65861_t